jgi:hypothetical protein
LFSTRPSCFLRLCGQRQWLHFFWAIFSGIFVQGIVLKDRDNGSLESQGQVCLRIGRKKQQKEACYCPL